MRYYRVSVSIVTVHLYVLELSTQSKSKDEEIKSVLLLKIEVCNSDGRSLQLFALILLL